MVITAAELRAKCFQLLARVEMTGERFQVTKRGKVVAELAPAPATTPAGRSARAGFARDSMRITGDIITPIDVDWEAMK